RYEKDGRQILSDIDFAIPKGKTIAIVGASGGGKSHILHTYNLNTG
ncbi:MAG: ATP-binding cassette domain-containing protein, partial [Lachnospiraceae bacterium]|nr:ATP-binding cassette domain-containing protein [Lachnospiraceae bacterium]